MTTRKVPHTCDFSLFLHRRRSEHRVSSVSRKLYDQSAPPLAATIRTLESRSRLATVRHHRVRTIAPGGRSAAPTARRGETARADRRGLRNLDSREPVTWPARARPSDDQGSRYAVTSTKAPRGFARIIRGAVAGRLRLPLGLGTSRVAFRSARNPPRVCRGSETTRASVGAPLPRCGRSRVNPQPGGIDPWGTRY
jgi:hypothetical protein